jgi:hypothetical protein
LSRKMTEAEIERCGYHRLAARGHMMEEELVAALSELDEIRETAERDLETARARGEALKHLEHDRDALMESHAGMVSEILEDLAAEERHRIYKLLWLGVRFRPDWPWRSRVPSRRWPKKQRRVRRIANLPHLAYKGFMNTERAEETGGVR